MTNALAMFAALLLGAMLVTNGASCADASPVTASGRQLAQALDEMQVETKWIAGAHIDWESGLPDGRPEVSSGRHTHCSAFVAAVAKKLGVYILRPPEHGQILLANAQNEWLSDAGQSRGWRRVPGPVQAQTLANQGMLVVATYHNRYDDLPGHIAIVRPADKSEEQIAAEGPQVIQAATTNTASISVRDGFAGHRHAWKDDEIHYYAHEIRAN